MNRKNRFFSYMLAGFLALTLSACASVPNEAAQGNKGEAGLAKGNQAELYVLAAASLADAMKELQTLYETGHPEVKLFITLGSSGTLQQQIQQGAPADLFFSAASKQMDALVANGLIDQKKKTNLLENELVLIVPKGAAAAAASFADLQKEELKKIAIGQPQTVPAGTYAEQSLARLGIWTEIAAKIVFAKDVRQVLTYVETGNTEAGIVYKTDALASDKVQIAATADPATHEPIVYPLGIVKSSKHVRQAEAFYEWLQGDEARKVFARYGFKTAGKP